FRQQATVHRALREDLKSRRAAVELEECVRNVLLLEQDKVESVTVLHTRAHEHLQTLGDVADEPEEKQEVEMLTGTFSAYMTKWNAIPPRTDPRHEAGFHEAQQFLKTEVLPQCDEVEKATHRRLDQTTFKHERVLQQLAWGMAGVAVLGGIAGIVV